MSINLDTALQAFSVTEENVAPEQKENTLHGEAKASAPASSLVDNRPAGGDPSLETCVGGGGRERRNLETKTAVNADVGDKRNSLVELGTRQSITPKVARYQERFGSSF